MVFHANEGLTHYCECSFCQFHGFPSILLALAARYEGILCIAVKEYETLLHPEKCDWRSYITPRIVLTHMYTWTVNSSGQGSPGWFDNYAFDAIWPN